MRQRKVAGLAYDREHGKLWQDIKADLDKTRARASKFADDAEWAFGRRTAQVLGVVMLFAVVVAILLVFLDWYINPTKPDDKKDLVLAMAQILAGTALLSGLYFTWRTLQVNREGQITERFTRAIEQLGATHDDNSKNLELRLGGIYALERIARESEEDHWSIMEILTAYVRQHAPWRPEEAQQAEEEEAQQAEEDAVVEKKSEEDSRGVSEPNDVPGLAADIQAIVTVIRRRTRSIGHGEPEPLDLQETNFSGAYLWEANLSRALLMKANLSGVTSWKVNLSRAVLTEANLSGAAFMEANLSGAHLSGADLSRVDLTEVNLQRAYLPEANLSGAQLGAPVDLSKANLRQANLSGADLSKANLSGAQLVGPVELSRADLSKADLSKAEHLTQKQLEETTGDKNTQLPPDLKPPAHWNLKTDEQIEGD